MVFSIAIAISAAMAFGFALLQVSLVFGAPLGEYVLGGRHKVLPVQMRFVSGAFSLVFAGVGVSYLQVAGAAIGLFSPVFVQVLLIAYTVFLAYAIIGNGFITKSKKEKYVMTPCSAVGFLSGVVVLLYSYV